MISTLHINLTASTDKFRRALEKAKRYAAYFAKCIILHRMQPYQINKRLSYSKKKYMINERLSYRY